jgi:hypothetical protein
MVELYQGEVLGEVLFDHMLSYFEEPDKQYKISVMLQLETETKARLRLHIDPESQSDEAKSSVSQ